MKCPKCNNSFPSEMVLYLERGKDLSIARRGIYCGKCKNEKGCNTWIKWGTEEEAKAIQSALAFKQKEKEDSLAKVSEREKKPMMYQRLLALSMKQMTITITNIVMKFVEADKKPTREEVALAVWNWLKRK